MVVIIDGANLAFRAYHTFSKFTNSKGYPTGMVYGFFSILNSYASQFGGKVVIAWEGPDNWRKEKDPEYKAKREKDEEITQGFKDVQRLCTLAGLLQIRKTGYEADDVISFIVRRVGQNIRIISRDKDLVQLIDTSKAVYLLKPEKDGLRLYDEKIFKEEYGFDKRYLVPYLAIAGDKSDNIKGVYGMGKVKTTNLINNEIDPIQKIKEMFPNEVESIDRNLLLINLLNPETMIRNLNQEDIICETSDIVALNQNFHYYEIRNYSAKELILNLSKPEDQQVLKEQLLKQIEYRY